MIFVLALVVFTLGYGAGIASYLQNDSLRWLEAAKSAMNLTLLAVLCASLVFLLLRRGAVSEKGRRRIVAAFAFFYLPCVVVISAAVAFNLPLEWLVVSILWLLMNLYPVIWCKRYVLKSYGQAAPVAFHGIQLERILDSYALSSREKEILELMLDGRSNKEIKELLFISIHTVRNHIYNIYRKLGVRSRGQLIRLIMEAQKKS